MTTSTQLMLRLRKASERKCVPMNEWRPMSCSVDVLSISTSADVAATAPSDHQMTEYGSRRAHTQKYSCATDSMKKTAVGAKKRTAEIGRSVCLPGAPRILRGVLCLI